MNYIKLVLAALTVALFFGGCKSQPMEISISGKIIPYNPDNDYHIRILETDHLKNRVIEVIEHEEMPDGNVQFSLKNDINFTAVLEVWENDTVRCILVPTEGNYIKNPVSGKTTYINVDQSRDGLNVSIKDIPFEIDRDNDRVLDYNLRFINPILSVENDYRQISGSLDSIPPGSRVIVLTDGGEMVQKYDFFSRQFDIETKYKTDYINIYIQSQYGWSKHLKEYEIGKLSLNY